MNAKTYLKQLLCEQEAATLQDILNGKEARAEKQKVLLQKGYPLLCFSLNIPGSYKRSPLFDKGFETGCELILQQLNWQHIPLIYTEKNAASSGCELYVLFDGDAVTVKRHMVTVEESNPLGRLFDIDILRQDGSKVSRTQLGFPPRSCLLCNEPAFLCGRSQKHSYEDLLLKTIQILYDDDATKFVEKVTAQAMRALLYEVSTYPKPGLVDRYNNGSHKDMDYFTFLDSTAVLNPFLRQFVELGRQYADYHPKEVLPLLRYPGLQAEETMKRSTKGVNCHKGIIFSLGVICCAIGMRYEQGLPFSVSETLQVTKQICSSLLDDFEKMKQPRSAGERLYWRYGIKGIRGEAASGYPTVELVGLPSLKRYVSLGLSLNDAGAWTLIELLCHTEDSNILSRSNEETLREVQKQCKTLLEQGEYDLKSLEALDQQFIHWNISPGGCADLLAITYFLYFMEQ